MTKQNSDCNILSICEYLNAGKPSDFFANAIGCLDQDEIKINCISSSQDINNQLVTYISPNPTTGKIFFKGDNLQKAKITVTELTGRILLIKKLNGSNEIDLPANAKGMLFVKIETEEGVAVKRVLKQ